MPRVQGLEVLWGFRCSRQVAGARPTAERFRVEDWKLRGFILGASRVAIGLLSGIHKGSIRGPRRGSKGSYTWRFMGSYK